jgi:hypothetical protein
LRLQASILVLFHNERRKFFCVSTILANAHQKSQINLLFEFSGQCVLLLGRRFLVFLVHFFQLFINLFDGTVEFA